MRDLGQAAVAVDAWDEPWRMGEIEETFPGFAPENNYSETANI